MSNTIAADIEQVRAALDGAGYLHGHPSGDEQRMFCPICEDPDDSHSPSASINLDTGMWNCLKSDSEHGGSLISLHKAVAGKGVKIAPLSSGTVKAVSVSRPKPRVEAKPVDATALLRIERAELRLWDEDRASEGHLRFLMDKRGLSPETITANRLGLEYSKREEDWRILIPVILDGKVINVRRYKMNAEPGDKMRSLQGHGSGAMLFGADMLIQHPDAPVLLCESELDCILANQEAVQEDGTRLYVAVTGTGGAGNVPANLDLLAGREVYIGYDADEAGRKGASAVAKRLAELGTTAGVLDLTALGLDPDSGQDITDLLIQHGTAFDLAEAFERAGDPVEIARQTRVDALVEEGRAREAARQVLSADDWEPPEDHGSWADQLANPPEPVQWRIEELLFDGANVMLNAITKAGKTVLSLNVARCLLTGEKLFDRFRVEKLASGRGVAWWNGELSRAQAHSWLMAMGFDGRPTDFHPYHLRGYSMPFDAPSVEEFTVRWLRDRNVSVWVLDPKAALFLGDENSNTETNAWLRAIDRIKRRAGVDIVIIVHHASESAGTTDEDDTPRIVMGRGASRQEGWADIIWSYTGRFDEPRYISALGRDVDLPPFGGLHMDSDKTLRWNGNVATPLEVRLHAMAVQMHEVLKEGDLNSGELKGKVRGKTDIVRKGLEYAISKGYVTQRAGSGNSKMHAIGEIDPSIVSLTGASGVKLRITTADADVEGEEGGEK